MKKKRIILEDTGERRHPKPGEYYVFLDRSNQDGAVFREQWGQEHLRRKKRFAILRVARNDFAGEPGVEP